ncbi:MAG TPA: S8 family serine peptidase, partial [Myxococcota bacterium]|nr:S8 family serine peptidase [Myxococcota bacterium]
LVPCSPGPPSSGHGRMFPSGEARDQAFRHPAPRGVGADRVQTPTGPPGARGEGVRLADIEHGWGLHHDHLLHPDLPEAPIDYGGEANALLFADHGTRVLGILLALHQEPPMDVRGLAPHSLPVLLLGNLRAGPRRQDIQTTDTQLGEALRRLHPGDIVLIEAQTRQLWGGALLPAQTDLPVADAIRACVARGISVVAAAGNGGQRWEPEEDPGSIVVAGGRWVQGRWERSLRSTYGPGIHCFAEGEQVTTTALPPPGRSAPFRVTTGFSGSSAAAAIVAGVAASVQGMARQLRGAPLRPAALRALLTHPELGTPAPNQEIGSMPDLERVALRIPRLPAHAFL